ncbi:transposase [Psychrobacter urativorans]|uniref:DDE-type integrase/transposase/recombinase n=1 Tax=Psychrobacter urativorans TaxID=45610 RepID=UPI00191B1F80|nr:DDE-type integrase/transposase/recombinase [Psychrobacter urativorans]
METLAQQRLIKSGRATFTYIRIKGGWCYLAVVLDLYARRIVGFAVSDSPDSMLTTKALQMAYQTRLQPIGVLFYSDQGTHYTSKTFAESVASCEGMTQSMTRKGNSLRAQPSALHSGKAVLC